MSRRLQATHSGGWGFCTGLGTTLRGGMVTKRPATPPNGRLGHAPDGHLQPLEPGVPLGLPVHAEAAQLRLGRRFPRPELHSALRDQVQHGDPLGDAGRMVVAGCGLDHTVADAHSPGPLAGCGQEDLWGARVGVLLEEVVLDLPEVLHPEPVGQLDLVEGVGDQLLFAGLAPGSGQLVLVEDPELHAQLLSASPPVVVGSDPEEPNRGRGSIGQAGVGGIGHRAVIEPDHRSQGEHLVHDVVAVGPVRPGHARPRP